MAGIIYEFIDSLKEENELYNILVQLASDKKSYIIKGDIDKINETNNKEENIVMKLKSHERKRVQLMADIASLLNENPKTITITRIIEVMANQTEEAEALTSIKDSLSKSLDKLRDINSENIVLINQSLEYAEFSLNVLQSQLGLHSTNADYGGNNNKQGQSIFDTKQ